MSMPSKVSQARCEAKKAIYKTKNDERKRFCKDLEREDEKGNLWPSGIGSRLGQNSL